MSFKMWQVVGKAFRTGVPVLTPLYHHACGPLRIEKEGEFPLGHSARSPQQSQFHRIAEQRCTIRFYSGTLSVRRERGRVWVNEFPVTTECEIRPGDVVVVGGLSFLASEAADDESASKQPAGGDMESADASRSTIDSLPSTICPLPLDPLTERSSAKPDDTETEFNQRQGNDAGTLDALRENLVGEHRGRERSQHDDRRMTEHTVPSSDNRPAGRDQLIDSRETREPRLSHRQTEANEITRGDREQSLLSSADLEPLAVADTQPEMSREVLLRHLDEVCQCEGNLESRSGEIQQQTRQLEEHQIRLAASSRQLEVLAREQQARNISLREQAEKLRFRETQLETQCASLAAWQTRLEQQQQQCAAMEQKLLKRTDELEARESMLSLKSKENAAQQASLEKLGESHASLGRQLQLQTDEINSRESDLRERLVECSVREAAVEKRDQAHAALEQEILQQAEELSARDINLQQRTEELSHREVALTTKWEELSVRERELNQMQLAVSQSHAAAEHEEIGTLRALLNQRDQSLREREERATAEVQELKTRLLELETVAQALRSADAERAAVVAERDAMLTAVRDLEQALIDARSLIEDLSAARENAEANEKLLPRLYQRIEDLCSQLQLNESRLRDAAEKVAHLQTRIDTLQIERERLLAERHMTVDPDAEKRPAEKHNLLNEIDSLQCDLTQSATCDGKNPGNEISTPDRRQTMRILRDEIITLREALEEKSRAEKGENNSANINHEKLQLQLEEYSGKLQERDEIIRALQARLTQALETNSQPPIDREALQMEARELDRRANLLDQREERIREREGRTRQAEEEVEGQRHRLLAARQQLETAHAKMQQAKKPKSAARTAGAVSPGVTEAAVVTSKTSDDELRQVEADPAERQTRDDQGAANLRAELASIFGMRKQSGESNMSPPGNADVIDVSEPPRASLTVAPYAGDDAAEIGERLPASRVEVSPESPAADENSDAFIREYMEQLLARSQKSAERSLSGELTTGDAGPRSLAAAKPVLSVRQDSANADKRQPQVKSFMEQYMAGGFDDLYSTESHEQNSESGQNAIPSSSADTRADDARIKTRSKIDRQKMRENMDSFRSVSSQSVEQALVSHALRSERLALNGRITLAVMLLIITGLLALAHSAGVVNQPILLWVTLASAVGTSLELTRKYVDLRSRSRRRASVAADEHTRVNYGLTTTVSDDGRTDNVAAVSVSSSSVSGEPQESQTAGSLLAVTNIAEETTAQHAKSSEGN